MATLGRPSRDYHALWVEFANDYKAKGKTLGTFCADKGFDYATVSTKFAELKRQAGLELFKSKNIQILLRSQANVKKAVNSTEFDPEFQAKYSLEALKAIADREGLSPQAATINITQQTATKITVAPLFDGSEETRAKAGLLIDGDVYPTQENEDEQGSTE